LKKIYIYGMSSRSRTGFSAAGAGLTSHKVNVALNTAGGFRKQGIASRVGLGYRSNRAVQIEANGTAYGRNLIFHINQLGGVGAGNSMFNVPGSFVQKRGVRRMAPYPFDKNSIS
jgi:hypothetical protein